MTRGPADSNDLARAAGGSPLRRPSLATLAPGAVLAGRYTVEREIGRGGMATVWLADERKHARKVAIKVLHPDLALSLGADRFLREIGIAARLAHPHIVPLIDSGEADGLLFYVSPYIAGGSLRARLDAEGRLAVREALRIGQEVAAALDFAHRSGFVHRDVKPENILFADRHAVLADFGVAQICCDDLEGASRVTDAGIALGTPEYMSPEQAAGERTLDAASDIYALACVVHEMLAGSPPFHGTTPRVTMARQVTEPPPPLRSMRPDTPPSVERVLARALAKDPRDRHASAEEFAGELAAESYETRAGGAAVPRSIAVLPFVNASPDAENEYLSDGITDELIDALAKVEGLRVASRTSVFALKGKPNDVRAIGALLGASVILEGTVRKAGSRLRITAQLSSTDDGALLWSQRFDRDLTDVFAIQDEIARTIVGTLRSTTLADLGEPEPVRRSESVAAYNLYLRGRFEWNKRTQEGIAEGIRWFERAIEEDPKYALAYTGLADSYALQVDYRSVPVHEGLERAKQYARMALALDETVAEAHASLAWATFIHEWNWTQAEREFRRAIELDPRYASARSWFAFLLIALGRHEEALVEAHAALELDPASISVRRGVAWMYYYSRRWERAYHHITRAIAMNPQADETHRVFGLTLAMEGRLGEAERVLRDAVTMQESGTYTRATLAYVLARAGRAAEARAIYAELEERARTDYVSPVSFATIHLGLGEAEPALDWAGRALEERRGWVAYLRVNPIFDPIRGHPRFEALARRMHL